MDQEEYQNKKPRSRGESSEKESHRKTYDKYIRGSVTPLEHPKLIDTLRQAAWLRQKPIFIEIGVWVAKTSKMMLQVLGDEMRPCHMINTDITVKARARWNKQCAKTAIYPNVKREYVKGGMKVVLDKHRLLPGSVSWVFIDGCHCFDCCSGDILSVRELIHPGGFLIIHDTDPRHEKGPWDQKYHGDKRPFGILKAIKEAKLETDFALEEEIPGVDAELRPFRCGMRIYRRLLDVDYEEEEVPKMEIEVTVSEAATSLIDGEGGSTADLPPEKSWQDGTPLTEVELEEQAPAEGGDRAPSDAPD